MINIIINSRRARSSMKRKLFGYMLALVLLMLLILTSGLFLLGRLTDARKTTEQKLDMQLSVFAREIGAQRDKLAALGIELSEDMARRIDAQLDASGIALSQLNDSESALADMQSALFAPLKGALLRANCSGAYVMLNATVNTRLPGAAYSRSGLYLQLSGSSDVTSEAVLYRGMASVGDKNDTVLHRMWRMEFDTRAFPDYEILALGQNRASFSFSAPITLPNTWEKAVLLSAPIIGKSGSFYGLCGFEIDDSSFKRDHAQPSSFPRMICVLTNGDASTLRASSCLCCGTQAGYFERCASDLSITNMDGGLARLKGDSGAYVGKLCRIADAPNADATTLAVMIPQADYDAELRGGQLQFIALLLIMALLCVGSCVLFANKYLAPILTAIGQMKRAPFASSKSGLPEIDDLMEFLAQRDKERDDELAGLREKQANAEATLEQVRADIKRLADKKRDEIDPDSYNYFRANISGLTPTERAVFKLYLEGLKTPEIVERMGFTERTLKFHNSNLYSKLGVSSKKELLRYVALLKTEQEEKKAIEYEAPK